MLKFGDVPNESNAQPSGIIPTPVILYASGTLKAGLKAGLMRRPLSVREHTE